ncbi:MAG: hypothetical protein HN778_05620 [Prolixibacteraceae bacterium]|jgi:hypothetical protein|nr:hypothetical protein [Prolixibacteraceae bacterium]MBT6999399.1 hypothetical protein [Prolixibacteraceae bacterium]MBT7394293.1 hypothetical protein [Prolixibacteraceae bacterium]
MLESDESLAKYGINMDELKDGVKAKLKDKAADYDSCIQVSIKLSWLVYQMEGAPECPADIKDYLESHCGKMGSNTLCSICLEEIPFELFHTAQRGKANIETCHLNPRLHDSENVGFGHRECNITQGNKTLEEFYEWISSILNRLNN